MASTVAKKCCKKCAQDGRPAAVVCNGCQHYFCVVCIAEHRQELAAQIDNVGREHDSLLQQLGQKCDVQVLLTRINVWEQESIAKIQTAAEATRVDLHEWTNRKKYEIQPIIDKVTDELVMSRKLNDYPEADVERWTTRLTELREMINNWSNIDIVSGTEATSIIHLIKLRENCSQQQPLTLVHERFDKAVGAVSLSDDGLRAAHLDHIGSNGSTCGVTFYSSGINRIRFQITGDWGTWFFSGIVTSLQEITSRTSETPSAYGWWDFESRVINGEMYRVGRGDFIKKDDELSLTLNCDKSRIELEHHRTNSRVHLAVDLQVCPLPWKFIVGFDWRGGCVRILH